MKIKLIKYSNGNYNNGNSKVFTFHLLKFKIGNSQKIGKKISFSLLKNKKNYKKLFPFVIKVNKLKMGYGRFGKSWNGSKTGNFYTSFCFINKNCNFIKIQRFNQWISLIICKILFNTFNLNFKVKWPNDIFLNDKKVGGILLEQIEISKKRELLILGIGLNLFKQNWKKISLSKKAISIEEIKPFSKKKKNLFEKKLILRILKSHNKFFSKRIDYQKDWIKFDYLINKNIKVKIKKKSRIKKMFGKVIGINKFGNLIIKDAKKIIVINSFYSKLKIIR
jgi:BirA family biotin operon repressor/biotin-[acetyl-CoA-carboxylase] ligase